MVEKKPSASDERVSIRIREAIRLICMVVFMGFLMMFVVEPINTYWSKWWPSILKKINSTYFGVQGVMLLLYTFPILFIAVLGCVYLHLGKKSNDNKFGSSNSKNHYLASWRRPILVQGPLGIVSATELAFFLMFMALTVWTFSSYLHNSLNRLVPETPGEKLWETKLENIALMLGVAGNIGLVFLFFPVTRGSSILPLFGLTYEGCIKYHIWLGHIVMILFTAHGLGYIIYWLAINNISQMLKWEKAGVSNVAGELSLLAGLFLWATTFPRIRRKLFELFFYTHYLYVLFVLFFVFHLGISYACFSLPGFYLFMVDRYLRFLQSRQRVRLVSARILPCQALELNFSKSPGLSYNPTSIVFINIPSISRLQWHPFTIHSNSNLERDALSILIKTEGSWTRKLYQKLSSIPPLDRLEVSVEGPYGPASTHFLRHDALVMVSGGSGIAPFISMIRELIFTAKAYEHCKTPNVTLICAFKTSADLNMLDILLPISGVASALSNMQLEIKAYVTREKKPATDNHSKNNRTIWFNPLPTDSPISAVLGPNSWLWLGAIISSSFIIFLVLIGVFTRYYVYPVDHNIKEMFSYATRASVNIWIACVCIAATASAAVLWNKKQNAKEANQAQNMEGMPSMEFSGDKELESLPHQSIAQVTNLHYGERPDLKKLLLGRQEPSVGVLVCGPKKMRHEVASICSSGSANNLHFEAISFSW